MCLPLTPCVLLVSFPTVDKSILDPFATVIPILGLRVPTQVRRELRRPQKDGRNYGRHAN